MANLQKMGSALLLEFLTTAASEKALLLYSDAPVEELRAVQRKIDDAQEELMRRLSW